MQILPPLTAVLRGGFSFGEVSVLAKPPNIANDEFKSAKWDELAAGRSFTTSDAPALALLCQWYKLAQQAMDELDNFGSQTAHRVKTTKKAQSAEIGRLSCK